MTPESYCLGHRSFVFFFWTSDVQSWVISVPQLISVLLHNKLAPKLSGLKQQVFVNQSLWPGSGPGFAGRCWSRVFPGCEQGNRAAVISGLHWGGPAARLLHTVVGRIQCLWPAGMRACVPHWLLARDLPHDFAMWASALGSSQCGGSLVFLRVSQQESKRRWARWNHSLISEWHSRIFAYSVCYKLTLKERWLITDGYWEPFYRLSVIINRYKALFVVFISFVSTLHISVSCTP